MESAEEFINKYLNEKAELSSLLFKNRLPFLHKYFEEDYVNLELDFHRTREANLETLESIESGEHRTRFITKESFPKKEFRHRYTISVSDKTWKISGKEAECFACKGNGQQGSQKCHFCNGNGWKDYLKSAPIDNA